MADDARAEAVASAIEALKAYADDPGARKRGFHHCFLAVAQTLEAAWVAHEPRALPLAWFRPAIGGGHLFSIGPERPSDGEWQALYERPASSQPPGDSCIEPGAPCASEMARVELEDLLREAYDQIDCITADPELDIARENLKGRISAALGTTSTKETAP